MGIAAAWGMSRNAYWFKHYFVVFLFVLNFDDGYAPSLSGKTSSRHFGFPKLYGFLLLGRIHLVQLFWPYVPRTNGVLLYPGVSPLTVCIPFLWLWLFHSHYFSFGAILCYGTRKLGRDWIRF